MITANLLLKFLFFSVVSMAQGAPAPVHEPNRFATIMAMLNFFPPEASSLAVGSSQSTHVEQHRLTIQTPFKVNEKNRLSASAHTGTLKFDHSPMLNKTGTKVPTQFYRSDVGVHYSRALEADRYLVLRGNLGYATDQPFARNEDLTFNLNGSYSFPGQNENLWALTFFVSNNSPIANYIPIPGFVYIYKKPTLTGMLGLPMASLVWMPVPPWSFSFFLLGPSLHLEAAYRLVSRMQFFVAGQWGQQSFFRVGRQKKEDRLIFEEKRVFLGVKSPLNKNLSGELQAGHALDRYVYEGDGFLNHDRGFTTVPDSWFAQINLRYLF